MTRLASLGLCVALCLPQGAPDAPGAFHEAGTPRSVAPAGGRPSLVVVIVVDQLAAGRLEKARKWLGGGFARFLDEGRSYTKCAHAHAATETGPGHATLLSGLFPAHNGIIGNDWFDREAHRKIYCAGAAESGPRNYDGSAGVSARNLEGENLADLVRRADPASKVFTVAGKDRSAILTGGHRPNAAYWYSLRNGGFTSNAALVPDLPAWGADFWGESPTTTEFYRKNIPEEWSYEVRPEWGPDDVPTESSSASRVSPHPMVAGADRLTGQADLVSIRARRVFTSPWVDWLTLQLARRILEHEALGADAAPDLLVVGLAGLDAVGHSYGPDSQEYLDTLVRVDGWLAEFMKAAGRAGREGAGGCVMFALSADHGVLPLPELVPGARRVKDDQMSDKLETAVAARLGQKGEGPFIETINWLDVYFDRRTLDRLGVPLARAIDAARAELSGWPEVVRVRTADELSSAAPAGADPFLDLYRNSFSRARSGDLVIQPCEKCLFTSRAEGTSHGSPYDYDRQVPMILIGPGIKAGQDSSECRTVDLAPTIASWLGAAFAAPRDGRPLPTGAPVDSASTRK